jgi:hypothetical protein
MKHPNRKIEAIHKSFAKLDAYYDYGYIVIPLNNFKYKKHNK